MLNTEAADLRMKTVIKLDNSWNLRYMLPHQSDKVPLKVD